MREIAEAIDDSAIAGANGMRNESMDCTRDYRPGMSSQTNIALSDTKYINHASHNKYRVIVKKHNMHQARFAPTL